MRTLRGDPTANEAKILTRLRRRPGSIVSRDALFRAIGYDGASKSRTVDMHVSRLRTKGHEITTIRGRGYRWDGLADDAEPPRVTQAQFRADSKAVVDLAIEVGRVELTDESGRVVAAVSAPQDDRRVWLD